MLFYILQTFKIILSSRLRFTRYVSIKTLRGDTKIAKCKGEMFIGFGTELRLAALSHQLTQGHLEWSRPLESSSLCRSFK